MDIKRQQYLDQLIASQRKPKRNDDGILTIGLKDFLLDKNSLNY